MVKKEVRTHVNDLIVNKATGRVYRVVSKIQIESNTRGNVNSGVRVRYYNMNHNAPTGIIDRAVDSRVIQSHYLQYKKDMVLPPTIFDVVRDD